MFAAQRSVSTATLLGGGLLLLGLTAAPASAAGVAPGSGFADAYALSVDTTLLAKHIPVVVPPVSHVSSTCPVNAAPATASLLQAGTPQVAQVGALLTGSTATCATTSVRAQASGRIADVTALAAAGPAVTLHADALTVLSSTNCTSAPVGSLDVVNLTLGGERIALNGLVAPNTVVVAPLLAPLGLTIILNEQHPTAYGRGLVVNAIHIIASGQGAVLPVGGTVLRGDVVIGHALSGVACPVASTPSTGTVPAGGQPTEAGLPAVTFTKTSSAPTAKAGDQLTYTATVHNTSATDCDVLSFTDHLAAPFTLVSTAGAMGTSTTTPAPVRSDGGRDAVLHPDGVTLAAHKTLVQTFTVRVNADAAPATYYDTLEIFCGPNGDFASGPLAPVTIGALPVAPPAPVVVIAPAARVVPGKPVDQTPDATGALPRTGVSPLLAEVAMLMLGAGLAMRRAAAG